MFENRCALAHIGGASRRWTLAHCILPLLTVLVLATPAHALINDEELAGGIVFSEMVVEEPSEPALTEPSDASAAGELKHEASLAPAVQESHALGVPRSLLRRDGQGDGDAAIEHDDNRRATALAKLDPRANDITQVIAALSAVLALIVVARYLLMRAAGSLGGAGRPSGVVEVLARYPVARGQQLVLLKLARRILLVHQSGSEMTTLSEVVDPDEVAGLLGRIEAGSTGRDAMRFRNIFRKFASEHEAASTNPYLRGEAATSDQAEVIDLTRNQAGSFKNLLGRGGAR